MKPKSAAPFTFWQFAESHQHNPEDKVNHEYVCSGRGKSRLVETGDVAGCSSFS
jgi:hypothetical protein